MARSWRLTARHVHDVRGSVADEDSPAGAAIDKGPAAAFLVTLRLRFFVKSALRPTLIYKGSSAC